MSSSFDPRLTPAREDLAADFLRGAIERPNYAKGVTKCVTAGSAPLHAGPDAASGRATELLMGEGFNVYEEKDGWAWGQAMMDDYVGYVPAGALGVTEEPVTHKIGVLRTFTYTEPDLKSQMLGALSLGSLVSAGNIHDKFTQIEGGAWVFTDHLKTVADLEGDYLTTAIRFIGVPYLWGGRTSLGIDCSGLVQIALQAAGVSAPRDTDMQSLSLGRDIEPDPAIMERGDLVFFPGHVGIMVDQGTLIHANAWDMMVSPHPLRFVVAEIAKEHDSPITCVKRLTSE
jgi:cell wall-associated NlpC family hydrolase